MLTRLIQNRLVLKESEQSSCFFLCCDRVGMGSIAPDKLACITNLDLHVQFGNISERQMDSWRDLDNLLVEIRHESFLMLMLYCPYVPNWAQQLG